MTITENQTQLINNLMYNYLKRQINEIFGEDNKISFNELENKEFMYEHRGDYVHTSESKKAISGFEQIKLSDIEKLKNVIQDVEIWQDNGQICIVFNWNKKTLATAEQFTTGNFFDGLRKLRNQIKA